MLAFVLIVIALLLFLPIWLSTPLLLAMAAMVAGLPWLWALALLALVLTKFSWWRRSAVTIVTVVCAAA